MRIRMLGDNCTCWKAGQEFDVHTDDDKKLYIFCHAAKEFDAEHYLLGLNDEEIESIDDYADNHEVIQE